jgi:DNA-binding winged helix-turn-helix (wHTH) protein/pimeloyl-ACP methyl ester carboxylesterase
MYLYKFGEFALDTQEHRMTRNGVEVRLRGKVFETLCILLQNAGKLLRKDELLAKIWPETIVEENNLDHCISQLRKIFGPENSNYIETVPRVGYRFTGQVQECEAVESPLAEGESRNAAAQTTVPKIPSQEICYFTTNDGVRIAYSQAGSGSPLVKAANWLNHLDFEWHSPIWAHWVNELTKHHTLYRYDERGNGLSDWNITDFSFQAWVRDFDQLMDTIKLDRFALLGISQGAAVAVSYAARHPERVSKLILYGGFARGWIFRENNDEVERRNALLTLVRLGWGKDNPAFRQLWTTLFMPDATHEQSDWFNELQRVCTSPENAVQLIAAAGKINIVDLLPLVRCPTIVLHSQGDSAIPIKEGRMLAARIPGAKFVELPSRNHLVIPPEPAWDAFVRALSEFMEWDTEPSTIPARRSKRALG